MCMDFRPYKKCTGQKPLRIKLIRYVRNILNHMYLQILQSNKVGQVPQKRISFHTRIVK